MSDDFRHKLFESVLSLFKDNGFDLSEIDKMYKGKIIDVFPEKEKKSFTFFKSLVS